MNSSLALGSGSVAGVIVAVLLFVLWLLGHRSEDDHHDPNAPDQDGFIPADKYGYGYDYSWGDPYGDPDL